MCTPSSQRPRSFRMVRSHDGDHRPPTSLWSLCTVKGCSWGWKPWKLVTWKTTVPYHTLGGRGEDATIAVYGGGEKKEQNKTTHRKQKQRKIMTLRTPYPHSCHSPCQIVCGLELFIVALNTWEIQHTQNRASYRKTRRKQNLVGTVRKHSTLFVFFPFFGIKGVLFCSQKALFMRGCFMCFTSHITLCFITFYCGLYTKEGKLHFDYDGQLKLVFGCTLMCPVKS